MLILPDDRKLDEMQMNHGFKRISIETNRNESNQKKRKMLRKLLKTNGKFHLNKIVASNVVHSSMHCATCKYLEDFFSVGSLWFSIRVCGSSFPNALNQCVAILIFKRRRKMKHIQFFELMGCGVSAYPKELSNDDGRAARARNKKCACVYL